MVEIVNDPLVHQVPIKRRGCRFPEEKPDHYKLFKYYSYSTCVLECRAIKMLEHCNCINHIIHPGKQVYTRVVPKSYENSPIMTPLIIVSSFPVRWRQRMLSRVVCLIFSTPHCVNHTSKALYWRQVQCVLWFIKFCFRLGKTFMKHMACYERPLMKKIYQNHKCTGDFQYSEINFWGSQKQWMRCQEHVDHFFFL